MAKGLMKRIKRSEMRTTRLTGIKQSFLKELGQVKQILHCFSNVPDERSDATRNPTLTLLSTLHS